MYTIPATALGKEESHLRKTSHGMVSVIFLVSDAHTHVGETTLMSENLRVLLNSGLSDETVEIKIL